MLYVGIQHLNVCLQVGGVLEDAVSEFSNRICILLYVLIIKLEKTNVIIH